MGNKFKNSYTKEDIKYILQSWGKVSPEEMAAYLKRPKNSLSYLAQKIREAGYNLPKNPRRVALRFIISEAVSELGLKINKENK